MSKPCEAKSARWLSQCPAALAIVVGWLMADGYPATMGKCSVVKSHDAKSTMVKSVMAIPVSSHDGGGLSQHGPMTPAGAAAFQRFTHQKTSPSPSLQTRNQIWALCMPDWLFHLVPPHFFILKNFHPIYSNVTKRAFQGIAHYKIAGIAQASDSSRVNCTRLKLRIKSLQRVNCTLSSALYNFQQRHCTIMGIIALHCTTVSNWGVLVNCTAVHVSN